MDERSEALGKIDGQITDLKKEGLVQAAAALERLKHAISGEKPLGEHELMAVFATNLEELERRIVAVESRE